MSGTAELLRRRQSRRAGTYDCDFLPSANSGRLRPNPAFRESSLHDVLLDLLDRHGRLVDPQHAGSFAGRGADSPSKFREVVVHRTPTLAEGHAAIHAPGTLLAKAGLGKVLINLKPIVHAFQDRTPRCQLAGVLQKSGRLTHVAPGRPRLRSEEVGQEHKAAASASLPVLV